MYRCGKAQEASRCYEHRKHGGSLPLIGATTYMRKDHGGDIVTGIELIRSTPQEKGQQVDNMAAYQGSCNAFALDGLEALQATAR